MNNIDREFQYSDTNFQFLKTKIKQLAGINLADTKNELVYSRVSRLLRQYHFNSFDEYCAQLRRNNPKMLHDFINAITTNYTSFMRENHHFDFLREHILPRIVEKCEREPRLRIWSAGCSTGEEAYSISFIVNDFFGSEPAWDLKILATDIDSDVLQKAQTGHYSIETLQDLSTRYQLVKDKYFELLPTEQKIVRVKDHFKKLIYFKQFNLMSKDPWPMHGPFDVIFCRNVMIYFDRPSQHRIIQHLTNLLKINGYLMLGHSESVPSILQKQLNFEDGAIYRRIQ